MEDIKNPSNQSLFKTISSDCSIEKNQNILKIEITFSKNSNFYKNLIFISISCFSLFLIFLWFNLIIQGVIYLIFLILIMIPCISGHLYYKNQKNEWIFDKSQSTIIFSKIFKHLKRIKTFDFSEVRSLIYQRDYKYWHSHFYNLSLIFNKNRISKIYIGEREKCKVLGSVISDIMAIPVQLKTQTTVKFE